MFPEINDFLIFCDYFLSFYRFIFSPYCLLLVTWGYFFASHFIFIKRKVHLMNHKISSRLQAVLLE